MEDSLQNKYKFIKKLGTGAYGSVKKYRDKETKQDVAIMKSYYMNVFKVTKDFATTRMTVAESAYRDFMKFIRWHVGQYAANAKQDQQGDVVQQQPQQPQQQDNNKIETPA